MPPRGGGTEVHTGTDCMELNRNTNMESQFSHKVLSWHESAAHTVFKKITDLMFGMKCDYSLYYLLKA